jgi:hypothetical protein
MTTKNNINYKNNNSNNFNNNYSKSNTIEPDSNNITDDITNEIIKSSLDFYDKYQPKIQKILNEINYIKIIDNNNINDEYVFYDSDNKKIFSSKIETLSIFIPQTSTWKWSWSIPFAKYKNTLISREILNYAFTLNSENDLFLKSTLVNSKIIIKNDYQLDIYLSLSALLSKKTFILKIYLLPPLESDEFNDSNNYNDSSNNSSNNSPNKYVYHYKKILENPNTKNYISVYVLLVDWVI